MGSDREGLRVREGRVRGADKEDFKRAALEKTDTIDVLSFVPASAIDSRYYETPYYVAPGKGADRAYALLRETMRKTGKVGVAQLILRQSQHLAALSVKDDVFVLTLLRLADDIAATDSVKAPSAKGLRDSELALAARLVDGLAGAWKPEQYKDQYAANLSAIIDAKIKGKGAKPRLGAIGPERAEGAGGRPDGAAAREPGGEHERAREAAWQGPREEDRRPRTPPRGVKPRFTGR